MPGYLDKIKTPERNSSNTYDRSLADMEVSLIHFYIILLFDLFSSPR